MHKFAPWNTLLSILITLFSAVLEFFSSGVRMLLSITILQGFLQPVSCLSLHLAFFTSVQIHVFQAFRKEKAVQS